MVSAATNTADGVQLSQQLLDEFRPFLEESVILAIVGDYDDLAANFESARNTLTVLAEGAVLEESFEFNPSGVTLEAVPSESQGAVRPDATDHSVFTDGSPAASSETTASDDNINSNNKNNASPEPLLPSALLDDLEVGIVPEDDKVPTLCAMFPAMKPFDIAFELRRAEGDFDKALGALLNFQYLDETGQIQRGTVEPGDHAPESSRPRRKKGKNRKAHPAMDGAKAKLRVDLPYSLAPLRLDDPDDNLEESASPGRSPLLSPISLTPSSRASPAPQATGQLAPSPATANSSDWQTVKRKRNVAPAAASGSNSNSNSNNSSTTALASPKATASPGGGGTGTALRGAAADSFSQAHAAWRRGKSDPLHRQVAGVYADRGHALVSQALAAERGEHEALVDRQSSAHRNVVDLHGVTVASGVEIALERTRAWWRGLGAVVDSDPTLESGGRAAAAKREKLYVVTGAGRHSVGGVSRLRQAVGVALARDGWVVEAERAQFVVSGRKR